MQVPVTALGEERRKVWGGIKLQSLAKDGRKGKRHHSPPPPTVPLQVVKVKNSRGGQEGSEGPGVAAARRARLVFLCYLVRGGPEIKRRRGKSRRLGSAIRLQERAVSGAFANVITDGTECACEEMCNCCDPQRKSDYMC